MYMYMYMCMCMYMYIYTKINFFSNHGMWHIKLQFLSWGIQCHRLLACTCICTCKCTCTCTWKSFFFQTTACGISNCRFFHGEFSVIGYLAGSKLGRQQSWQAAKLAGSKLGRQRTGSDQTLVGYLRSSKIKEFQKSKIFKIKNFQSERLSKIQICEN